MRRTSLKYFIQQLSLILLGLILIIIGNQFTAYIYKIEIGELLSHIGALIFFIGTLHYLFDYNLRKEFQSEISAFILGNTNLHRDGIIDSTINSKEIKEQSFITSTKLIVSVAYSLRFLQTNLNILELRSLKHKKTIIVHYDPAEEAAKYLNKTSFRGTSIHAVAEQLKSLLYENNNINKDYLNLVSIKNILRYNFIYTDNFIWLKIYTNSEGTQSEIPAIKINYGTPYFKYFEKDILKLVGEISKADFD